MPYQTTRPAPAPPPPPPPPTLAPNDDGFGWVVPHLLHLLLIPPHCPVSSSSCAAATVRGSRTPSLLFYFPASPRLASSAPPSTSSTTRTKATFCSPLYSTLLVPLSLSLFHLSRQLRRTEQRTEEEDEEGRNELSAHPHPQHTFNSRCLAHIRPALSGYFLLIPVRSLLCPTATHSSSTDWLASVVLVQFLLLVVPGPCHDQCNILKQDTSDEHVLSFLLLIVVLYSLAPSVAHTHSLALSLQITVCPQIFHIIIRPLARPRATTTAEEEE